MSDFQNITGLKPSNFTTYPWNSITQKSEYETTAQNIMKIMKRLGDNWGLTWSEYKRERQKDGGFSETEKRCFEHVYPMISDCSGAALFCSEWGEIARKLQRH